MSHYKSYPAYKDSGVEWIGDVPEHWEVKRMRHVAEYTNSNVDKKEHDCQENIHLCNYTDVYYNEFVNTRLPFMPSTASQLEIKRFSLIKGDVLITKDSESPDDIGIPALVTEDMPGIVCGYHLALIRSFDYATARILHRALQSHPTKAHFFVEAPGITRYGLSQDAIGDLQMCIPPLEERNAIADWIDRETIRIDALIAKKTRFIELLKEKRQALISHAVTKGLNPNVKMKDSGVEWIGDVPEHWAILAVKRLSPVKRGASPRPIDDKKYFNDENGEFGWVRIEDVTSSDGVLKRTKQKLSKLGASLSVKLPIGSLFLSIAGSVGKPCINLVNVCIHDGFVYFPNLTINPVWLSRIFETRLPFVGLGKLGTQLNLNTETVGMIKVGLPPEKEIKTIVEYIKEETVRIDLIIEKTQRSIDLLKERRSAFITAAVTGQIDLRESL